MYLSDDGDVLDLTGNQLKDLAGIPLPPTLTDLDLTTNRLAALDPRIGGLERLEKLSFRQNLITDAAGAGLKDLTRLTSLKVRSDPSKGGASWLILPSCSLLHPRYNHIHQSMPRSPLSHPANQPPCPDALVLCGETPLSTRRYLLCSSPPFLHLLLAESLNHFDAHSPRSPSAPPLPHFPPIPAAPFPRCPNPPLPRELLLRCRLHDPSFPLLPLPPPPIPSSTHPPSTRAPHLPRARAVLWDILVKKVPLVSALSHPRPAAPRTLLPSHPSHLSHPLTLSPLSPSHPLTLSPLSYPSILPPASALKARCVSPLPPPSLLDLSYNHINALPPHSPLSPPPSPPSLLSHPPTPATRQELVLRDNLLKKELVLRDNLLKKVPLVSPLTALSLLDLSYNHIHGMAPLASSALPALRELYLANNRIGHIEALEGFTQLRLLELGSNKIREMENLSHLSALEELWVGRNKIREVRVDGLSALVKISVQSNRLTCMRGFETCTRLQELYLSNNGITVMEGLEALTNLRILDLAANAITHVQGLDTLTSLEDLWLNDNRIESLAQLMAALQVLHALTASARMPSCATAPCPHPSPHGPTSLEDLWLNDNRIESLAQLMAALQVLPALTASARMPSCATAPCPHPSPHGPTSLEDLWLNDNRIESLSQLMASLHVLPALTTCTHCISPHSPIHHPMAPCSLEDLWLNDNRIESLAQLMAALDGPKASLVTLYLERNPCAKEAGYIETLAMMLPRAEEIDSKPIETASQAPSSPHPLPPSP
ncbi:unnamed protein product [Closterium sp. Naga37s-1]|nr:unnamed protein product [Closterium sp. Naga37s-1]